MRLLLRHGAQIAKALDAINFIVPFPPQSSGEELAHFKNKTFQLRNEAPLNFVSLRSALKYGGSERAVKGQDERPYRAPLTAPPTPAEKFVYLLA